MYGTCMAWHMYCLVYTHAQYKLVIILNTTIAIFMFPAYNRIVVHSLVTATPMEVETREGHVGVPLSCSSWWRTQCTCLWMVWPLERPSPRALLWG